MERVKKEATRGTAGMSPMQMGNQAVVQRCGWGKRDEEWKPGKREAEQERIDASLPEEAFKWRGSYGGFIKSKYDAFKAKNMATPCAYGGDCLNRGYGYDDSGKWKFSIDHIISVSGHWNHDGSKMTDVERHEWYNNVTNWQPMHLACNASKGG